jgi:predicted homoserine dehydrogenase-like protein
MITTAMLRELADKGLRVGLIGAGKFGTMFLSQARRVPGLHVVGVADLNVARARESLARADWPAEQYAATTYVGDDALALIAGGIDVIVDATGHPQAGARHALAALNAGVHMVLPNVESDVLVGPLLAERFAKAGLAYSMAYGDQPALIVELVDWARAAGFPVVCAGKGTKYLPQYHHSTPDTVWDYFGFTAEQLAVGVYRRHQSLDRDGGGRQRHRASATSGRAAFPAVRHRRSANRAAPRIGRRATRPGGHCRGRFVAGARR